MCVGSTGVEEAVAVGVGVVKAAGRVDDEACTRSNILVGKVVVGFGLAMFVEAVDVGGCMGRPGVGEDVVVGCGVGRRQRGKCWRLCERCRRRVY